MMKLSQSKISIVKLDISDGFEECLQAFTVTILIDSSASNLDSKNLTLKPNL